MKHFKKFEDINKYQSYINSDNYIWPNVSLINDNKSMYYEQKKYDSKIEYLESTGTQHILSDLYGSNEIGFEIKFSFSSKGSTEDSGSATIFGSRTNATTASYQLSTFSNGTVSFKNLNSQFSINSTNIDYIVRFENNKIYVNGAQKKTINVSYVFTTPTPLVFFALYQDEYTEHLFGKIYYIKFFNRTTLEPIAEYIPVRKGNVGYMYNKISRKILGNIGTDNFILGPDIT